MKTGKLALAAAGAILLLAPLGARADSGWQAGRTGLPTVRDGGEKVWMEHDFVRLDVRGNDLYTQQEVRLHCPGPPIQKDPVRIQVGVRDDFWEGNAQGITPFTVDKAEAFKQFDVWVDGQKIDPTPTDWQLNQKGDTATRWMTWYIDFAPGQRHEMRIETLAPLGRVNGRPTVQFVTKDVGHWRDVPDLINITLSASGLHSTDLVSLDPKPTMQGRNVHWVFRKVQPKRDIVVSLPGGANRPASLNEDEDDND